MHETSNLTFQSHMSPALPIWKKPRLQIPKQNYEQHGQVANTVKDLHTGN